MTQLFKEWFKILKKNPNELARCDLFSFPRKESLKLCQIAIEKDPASLQYVPDKFQTQDLCLRAIKQNPWASILYVKKQTPELCLIAMELDPEVYNFISVCPHPNPEETIKNLKSLVKKSENKKLIKSTLRNIS